MYEGVDPLELGQYLWPDVGFYDKQVEIIDSVWNDEETVVHAGNMLGKDFVAAFIVLMFFLTRWPCRIVTTSVDATQLEGVLWGEIKRFIQTSRYPLEASKGGPLEVTHQRIRRVFMTGAMKGEVCGISYILGRVAKRGEGMLGHHCTPTSGVNLDDGVPRTLFVADEASGVDDVSYERADTWADRKLIIGNPYPTTNFFFKAVEGGDLLIKEDVL